MSGTSATGVEPPSAHRDPIAAFAPVAFVGIGVTESVWGVVWKPLHEVVGQPEQALGLLLIAFSAGYLSATLSHGTIVRRSGTGRFLVGATTCGLLGATGFAFGSSWPLLVAAALLLGIAGGGVDAGLNSYASVRYGPRVVNFMLAGFGVGAVAGPFLFAVVLQLGWSWRVVYVVLVAYEAVLLAAWLALRHRFGPPVHPGATGGGDDLSGSVVDDRDEPPGRRRAPYLVILGLSVLGFFVYVGVEQGIGTWSFWVLTDRGMGDDAARWWTTAFWASLAVGRVGVGLLSRRVGPPQVLAVGIGGGVVATILLWLGGTTLAPAGLLVGGLAYAGVFPSFVSLTPSRVGRARTAHAMGFQLAAASLGVAGLVSLLGVLRADLGVGVVAPALVVEALVLLGIHVVTGLVAGDLRRSPAPLVVDATLEP